MEGTPRGRSPRITGQSPRGHRPGAAGHVLPAGPEAQSSVFSAGAGSAGLCLQAARQPPLLAPRSLFFRQGFWHQTCREPARQLPGERWPPPASLSRRAPRLGLRTVGGQGETSFPRNLHAGIHSAACTALAPGAADSLRVSAAFAALLGITAAEQPSLFFFFFFETPVPRASLEFLRLCFREALLLKLCDTVTEKIRRGKQ